jgi:hypothetical protein
MALKALISFAASVFLARRCLPRGNPNKAVLSQLRRAAKPTFKPRRFLTQLRGLFARLFRFVGMASRVEPISAALISVGVMRELTSQVPYMMPKPVTLMR